LLWKVEGRRENISYSIAVTFLKVEREREKKKRLETCIIEKATSDLFLHHRKLDGESKSLW
jgi:hypothetical protein